MKTSGLLVPYPDPGAADMMSDHLEQVVEAAGPGTLICRVTLPPVLTRESSGQRVDQNVFAAARLEISRRIESAWNLESSFEYSGSQDTDEVSFAVNSAGTVKCKLMNNSRIQGQFSLECTFVPDN